MKSAFSSLLLAFLLAGLAPSSLHGIGIDLDFNHFPEGTVFTDESFDWASNHPDMFDEVVVAEEEDIGQYLRLRGSNGGIRNVQDFYPLDGKVVWTVEFRPQAGPWIFRLYESSQTNDSRSRSVGFDVLSDGRVRMPYDGDVIYLGNLAHGFWYRATVELELPETGEGTVLASIEIEEMEGSRPQTLISESQLEVGPADLRPVQVAGAMIVSRQTSDPVPNELHLRKFNLSVAED